MCDPSNKSIEELEDLFKHDEMNTITNIDEETIVNYLKSLYSFVKEHINKESETKNIRLIVNKLK